MGIISPSPKRTSRLHEMKREHLDWVYGQYLLKRICVVDEMRLVFIYIFAYPVPWRPLWWNMGNLCHGTEKEMANRFGSLDSEMDGNQRQQEKNIVKCLIPGVSSPLIFGSFYQIWPSRRYSVQAALANELLHWSESLTALQEAAQVVRTTPRPASVVRSPCPNSMGRVRRSKLFNLD